MRRRSVDCDRIASPALEQGRLRPPSYGADEAAAGLWHAFRNLRSAEADGQAQSVLIGAAKFLSDSSKALGPLCRTTPDTNRSPNS